MYPMVSRFRGDEPGSILYMTRPRNGLLTGSQLDISSVESRPYSPTLVDTQVPALVFRFLVSDFPAPK